MPASVTAPGLFAALWPTRPDRVDKFTSMRWMPPSTMRLVTGICTPGAVPESGTGYHAIHMLTPETDSTTHYFFTAVRFNVQTADEALNREIQDKISTTRRFAFEEQDAPVIEAQQLMIDSAHDPVDPLILAIDVGPVRYKRILQKNDRRRADVIADGTAVIGILTTPGSMIHQPSVASCEAKGEARSTPVQAYPRAASMRRTD